MSDARLLFRDWLLEQEGKPYIYGAKGPDWFDCSGCVTCGLKRQGVPDPCEKCGLNLVLMHNTQRLWKELEPTDEPFPMDLAFYGRPINHVMVVWGDGRVYGACGGDSTTRTLAEAHRRKARVQFRSKVHNRKDFRGYRRIPLL